MSNVIPFTPDFKFANTITFDGKSFEAWCREVLPKPLRRTRIGDEIPLGEDMWYVRRRMPMYHTVTPGLFSFRSKPYKERASIFIAVPGRKTGEVTFDKPTVIPTLLDSEGTVWMSLTPNEVLTQRKGIISAKGHVMIGGLGMGWFLQAVLAKSSVKSVTVVERSAGVIEAFTPHEAIAASGKSVTVVNCCAFDYAMNHDHDKYLFDTWDSYGTAEYDPAFRTLKKKVGEKKCWGWGDVKHLPYTGSYWG